VVDERQFSGGRRSRPGRPGTILAIDRLVDDPAELRRLHEETGANAVDMAAAFAATGRCADARDQ
jgi:nucleoside phosphorylase